MHNMEASSLLLFWSIVFLGSGASGTTVSGGRLQGEAKWAVKWLR